MSLYIIITAIIDMSHNYYIISILGFGNTLFFSFALGSFWLLKYAAHYRDHKLTARWTSTLDKSGGPVPQRKGIEKLPPSGLPYYCTIYCVLNKILYDNV
jgi:hypothetical protein